MAECDDPDCIDYMEKIKTKTIRKTLVKAMQGDHQTYIDWCNLDDVSQDKLIEHVAEGWFTIDKALWVIGKRTTTNL